MRTIPILWSPEVTKGRQTLLPEHGSNAHWTCEPPDHGGNMHGTTGSANGQPEPPVGGIPLVKETALSPGRLVRGGD